MSEAYNPCAVVPVYRHGKTLLGVVQAIMSRGLPVIVVDDGNESETKGYIEGVKKAIPDVEVVTLAVNGGKGAAVLAGIFRARDLGYTHAFQIDADGQHDAGPIAQFIEASRQKPEAVICGYPVYGESAPSSRKNGRKITNFWVAIETLSFDIQDAMCGFRLYPVAAVCKLASRAHLGLRMTFDIDIIVRLHWVGVRTDFLPIGVTYPEGGVSNFRMVRDNVAISAVHTRLFFGMIVRLPLILLRKAKRHG